MEPIGFCLTPDRIWRYWCRLKSPSKSQSRKPARDIFTTVSHRLHHRFGTEGPTCRLGRLSTYLSSQAGTICRRAAEPVLCVNRPRNSIVRSMTWMRGFLLLTAAAAACVASIGPSHGTLLIVGGGTV